MIRRHIVFYGWVQGVGFRYRARHAADLYSCTGWVKNEWDGSVTMEIQGEEENIDRVILANLTVKQEAKREGKKSITFAQMEAFIAMHRNADELTKRFNNVRKLSRIQPMPYKYVKTWFENTFPYYSDEQHTFDADGFVIDPATLTNMRDMVQEVTAANVTPAIEAVPEQANAA